MKGVLGLLNRLRSRFTPASSTGPLAAAKFEAMRSLFLSSSGDHARSSSRLVKPSAEHTRGEPFVLIRSLVDRADIHALQSLAASVTACYPSQVEFRSFGASAAVLYSGDEVQLPGDLGVHPEHGREGGGNHVTFVEGFVQRLLPALLAHVMEQLSAASVLAGWHPYPLQLGLRCVERLVYEAGGQLILHTDSGSVYTVVLMLSDPSRDFKGGDFVIRKSADDEQLLRVALGEGDAMMFDSNSLHGIDTIVSGQRRVLVLELWPFEDSALGARRPDVTAALKFKLPLFLQAPA